MLIGSALQNRCIYSTTRGKRGPLVEDDEHAIDLVAFFEALSANAGHIRLVSLSVETLDWPSAYVLADYLPKATHFAQPCRVKNGRRCRLHIACGCAMPPWQFASCCHDQGTCSGQHTAAAIFTADELGLLQASMVRNQEIPSLLRQPVVVVVAADIRTDDESSNLRLYARLFVATRPAVRMTPNNLVMGLLSGDGDEDVGW